MIVRSGLSSFGMLLPILTIILTFLPISPAAAKGRYVQKGVCTGTDQGTARPYNSGNADDEARYYADLKERYTNCTYVDGNLEISFLHGQEYDLSFLSSIREVTGYVLILLTYARVIPLTDLRVIRGTRLYEDKYALYVALTFHTEDSSIATEEIWLTSLHEILRGEVYFHQNNQLCYVETIAWDDMQPGLVANISMWDSHPKRDCSEIQCHESCDGHCWGPGPEHCQTLTLKICSSTCDYRCRGRTQADCCHRSCAAGCTNSTNAGCLACRQFSLDNTCVESCPRREEYDRTTFTNVLNPNFRYSYGSRCLKNCPENVLIDGDNCVKVCGPGKREQDNECIPCDGVCPSTCSGLEAKEILDETHLDRFRNCTKINGNLIITSRSLHGDIFEGRIGFHPRELEVFSTVKHITGYLSVQADHTELTNLSSFRNLERIDGRALYGEPKFAALAILDNTFVETANFVSLKSITNGGVYVQNNGNLCYLDEGAFLPLVKDDFSVSFANNRDKSLCISEGKVCDPQCDNIGCWGPGPMQCAKCKNAIIGNKCVAECDLENGQYVETPATDDNPAVCEMCDVECSAGCYGPGPDNCTCMSGYEGPNCRRKCRNVQDGPYCRQSCPELKFANAQKNCTDCHPNCLEGCNGPDNTVGITGCFKCEQVRLDYTAKVVECMPHGEPCGEDYFYDRISLSQTSNKLAGSTICQRCDPMCVGCDGAGPRRCTKCKFVKQNQECVQECTSGTYPDQNNVCMPCHGECRTCYNGTEYDCVTCNTHKVEIADEQFFCAPECPKDYPYQLSPYICGASCKPLYYPNRNRVCTPCHAECLEGCHNGSHEGCFSCRNVKWQGGCYQRCHAGEEEVNGTCVLYVDPSRSTNPSGSPMPVGVMAAIGVAGGLLLFIIFLLACWYRRHTKNNMYIDIPPNIDLHDIKSSDYGGGPLTPSNVTPNQAQLKIIKDTELKLGPVLGSGAFGTVYKGLWIPEGEKIRIPVAIKALREVSSSAAEELLEEAKVMASVDHPCLLRLLCVCIAQNMTLITQLMPLGALLDYVRQHKEQIGSHHLLNWSHQIAKGMVYLEEKHLIHRDLAARNVLVQSPAQVKITDFGLAKFLDIDENEYKAQGGKMPIKWLALECIQFRRFSHKSDVWSFGVTLWELMTFGGKPYEGVKAREVPDLLERGERLPQPPICTIDIYMLMVKCWLIDEDSRPTFKQMQDELERMTKDPQRYLVIQNDGINALPSPTPSDFYKSLMADTDLGADPDLLMDAEDYLQPMSLTAHNLTYESQQGFFPPNGSTPKSPTEKPGMPSRKDSSLLRYCQDPTVRANFDRQSSAQEQMNDDYLIPNNKLENAQPLLEEEHDYQNDPRRPANLGDAYLPLNDGTGSQPSTPSAGGMMDNMEYHAIMSKAAPTAKSPTIHTGDPWTPMVAQHPHLMTRQHSNSSQPRTPTTPNYPSPNVSYSTPLLSDVSFEGPVPRTASPPGVANGQSGATKGAYRSQLPSSSSGSLGRRSNGDAPENDYVNSDVVTDRGESTV
ncbi:receptor tyrosine-protein kinase erbB-4-like [Diadema setosum]|uniref:receptor tyrosine-protein kinase erbB-4-like n=1 Tax=Diadema setosum TaxID=31175 RepID=UPI003B3A9E7B